MKLNNVKSGTGGSSRAAVRQIVQQGGHKRPTDDADAPCEQPPAKRQKKPPAQPARQQPRRVKPKPKPKPRGPPLRYDACSRSTGTSTYSKLRVRIGNVFVIGGIVRALLGLGAFNKADG